MKGEHQQGIYKTDHEWEEESNNSPLIYKNAESSRENKANLEEATTMSNPPQTYQFHTIENEQKLKMIVRSQYWGRELKGRTCRNVFTKMDVKAPLVITSQVVLYNTDGFWGCCPTAGKRVLELQEHHFSDASEGCNWDLYIVGTWVSPAQSTHDFFLLPQNQTSVDIERNVSMNGWCHWGTCAAGQVRSAIDKLLRNLLKQNDARGHRYHHVHIDIMMNNVYDRETPRSRKVSNEKARAKKKKSIESISGSYQRQDERQESSVTTEATVSTEQESPPSVASRANTESKPFATKAVGIGPEIPSLIPAGPVSYLVPASHQMVSDARWTGESSQWSYDQYPVHSRPGFIVDQSRQLVTANEHQGVYWHLSAKRMPPPAQQHNSYWNPGLSGQFHMTPSQQYGHPLDSPMYQYQHYPMAIMGSPHNYQMNQCHMMIPGNHHHVADPLVMCREIAGSGNAESLGHSFANLSTRDDSTYSPPLDGRGSPPPAIAHRMSSSALLDIAEISPIVATDNQTMPSNMDSGVSSPHTPSPHLDTAVGASAVDATAAPATNTTELHSTPTSITNEQ